MKKLITLLTLALCLCLLTGCMGTPVIYHSECTCPTAGDSTTPDASMPENGLRTGLAIVSNVKDSTSAKADGGDGVGTYDITLVAVTVDKNGIIHGCMIDGVSASITFNTAGEITSDKNAEIKTKNELGDAYGMVAYGQAKYEWYVQAKALADFAIGKTVKQLKEGAIDETTGKAPEGSDLASTATIYLAGYVSAIERAVSKATYLGASIGDSLHMAVQSSAGGSTNAGEKDGYTQIESTATAMTMKGDTITSCTIDSVQAKVSFNASGTITSNLKDSVKTKNELGADYNMVKYGGAIAEWDVQVASFCKYVVGKTPAQVAGIAVDATTKPTEADLTTSVTITIGGFQALIQKAAQ